MRRMILACSVLLALSTGATAGQIYKWVDGQGNVHFGSQPPEGQDAAAVTPNIAQPKLTAPTPAVKNTEKSEQDIVDEKVRQEVAKQEAERKKFCEAARYNLAQLKNNPRARIEVKGEVRRLSEEERQAQISEIEKAIAENCQ
ncbi:MULTISPECIES: DUF4124 domain-containing protein [unclassified Pseudomonas]|uniref:DUF4124 domain-containing protein n=1 Tax=unclassified Pseudomonas TaxID=196821 RepID=UPI0024483418|nr:MULTISPECIES: DUF4124 domain-containing protein [unclassified Pseudomonas]MDG9923717.1 DUF4124 domain-containing protein [Pseudomonas sp. GD04045]MDH0036008.1 DUF4124 domain-containing protein [Pseudomonas sp. GD04019]